MVALSRTSLLGPLPYSRLESRPTLLATFRKLTSDVVLLEWVQTKIEQIFLHIIHNIVSMTKFEPYVMSRRTFRSDVNVKRIALRVGKGPPGELRSISEDRDGTSLSSSDSLESVLKIF